MTGRVSDTVACGCGYRGRAVDVGGRAVCPICRTAASGTAPSGGPSTATTASPRPSAATAEPQKFRVPCPRGHLLKAGAHLFGQQVVCPECNEPFLLRAEDSVERRKERERERLAAEERFAKRWLGRSIWAAAFIVAALAGLIVFSLVARPPATPPADPPSVPDPADRSG